MSDRQQLIKVLFHAVAELETDEARHAFLDDQCSDNAPLKQEVLGLFAHDRQLGSFMERKQEQAVMAMDMPSEDSFHESIDETIGPYKLREKLGVGGMGIVYVAEQTEPVHRKVALKIIKPGMDSKEVLARFEAERQALAMMSHPNIAKILDGGTTKQGRPYFVMELVRGIPITEFSDQHKLDTPQRLELFIKVCKAVQHAHLKGIIHRDLKPSNVMVEVQDVEAVPKVIDFGIAKAINQRLSQHTVYTPYAQLIGTPMYMSPEQAQLSGLDVDTRSDIYSLGVLLYELLTGTTPFERETLEKSGFDEMRRMICDVDPPKPSVRLSTLNAAALSTIADRRRVDPRKLHQSLHGELDWIVMKALEKDRKRRYESASDFAPTSSGISTTNRLKLARLRLSIGSRSLRSGTRVDC